MRIIGGRFRGRKIKQPETKNTRPTKDRIREAVFNMIAHKVTGSRVIDMFAGSGAYGLEALSRGAGEAVFIDNNSSCISTIRENISLLGADLNVEILDTDASEAIEFLAGKNKQADLIFLDPPYNRGMAKKALIIINHYDILSHSGLVVIEHHRDECVPTAGLGVSILKQKTYKDILISIFLKK